MVSLIEPEGVEVLYYTTSSCGHKWARDLLSVNETISLTDLAKLGPGSEIFGNLANYAQNHKLAKLTRMDVLRYFVTDHLGDANRSANFNPAKSDPANELFGKLLANCAVWPLSEDGCFELAGKGIRINGAEDIGGKGKPFLHRRTVFHLPVSESENAELKSLLSENPIFVAALQRVGGELRLPLVSPEHK